METVPKEMGLEAVMVWVEARRGTRRDNIWKYRFLVKKRSFLVAFLKHKTQISSNAVDEQKRPRRTWKRRLEESQTARSAQDRQNTTVLKG